MHFSFQFAVPIYNKYLSLFIPHHSSFSEIGSPPSVTAPLVKLSQVLESQALNLLVFFKRYLILFSRRKTTVEEVSKNMR